MRSNWVGKVAVAVYDLVRSLLFTQKNFLWEILWRYIIVSCVKTCVHHHQYHRQLFSLPSKSPLFFSSPSLPASQNHVFFTVSRVLRMSCSWSHQFGTLLLLHNMYSSFLCVSHVLISLYFYGYLILLLFCFTLIYSSMYWKDTLGTFKFW